MTRLVCLVPCLLLWLAACAGKTPETRFYQLATPATSGATNHAGVTLAIEPLDTDPAYDDERMVYRLTPYRLDYYNYHRWSSAPGTLIADFLERSFENSGRFRTVTRDGHAAPVTLGGRVVAIEEVDKSKTTWVGRIVVELRVTDATTGDVLWTEQYEETEPVKEQTPEGLAAALSTALRRISDRALPIVADLALRTAQAKEPEGKASTSRAARLKP
jgi:ABC-type uncharacterized transport system auxiliary subunit